MTHGHLRRAARVALGAAMVGFVIGAGAQEPQGSPPNGQSGISRQHVDERGIPRFIEGRLGLLRGDAHHRDSDIRSFLQTYAGSLRADGSESLAIRRAHKDAAIGKRHYRASQRINGLDVVGGEIIFHVDEQTAEIYAIDAQFLPGTGLPRAPLVRAQAVAGLIAADVGIELDPTDKHDPHLVYLRRATGAGLLAWKLEVSFSDREGARQILDVYVDAINGEVVERYSLVQTAKNRSVYDVIDAPPGNLLLTEGQSTAGFGVDVVGAYNHSGSTYDYYWQVHGRDAWNGQGAVMRTGIGLGDANAFWCTGSNCFFGMAVFGSGGNFDYLSTALDVVTHEFTHGVTTAEAALVYEKEPGAMNESMSDIFGAAAEAWVEGMSPDVWLAAEDAYTPATEPDNDALRYMNDPILDGSSPDYYPDRLYPSNCTPSGGNDWCGVHHNSGISNLAFYMLTQGGTHPRGKTSISVPGIGITKAEKIFYLALTSHLQSQDGFIAAKNKTAKAAKDLYSSGNIGPESEAVCKAWDAVGVPDVTSGVNECADLQPPANVYSNWLEACNGYNDVWWSASTGAARYELWRSATQSQSSFNPGVLIYSGPNLSSQVYISPSSVYRWVKVKACPASGPCSTLSTAIEQVRYNYGCP